MRRAAIAAVFVFACHAQEAPLTEILNFEAPHSGTCPAGWSCNPPGTIAAESEVVHGGKWSVRIERKPGSPNEFSTIIRAVPLNFAGAKIELRGFIRSEDVKGFSAFWIREDDRNGSVAFESMQGKNPVAGTTPWAEYSISLPIKDQADKVTFGFLLSGTGRAWADDLQLLVDGKPAAQAPRRERTQTNLDTDREFERGSGIKLDTLSKTQIDNLATLGKVWGFLKYHHPAVTSGQRHFDYDLFRIMPAVLAASNRESANEAILKWITGLGGVGDCRLCASLDEKDVQLRPDLDWLNDQTLLGLGLSRTLKHIYDNRPRGAKQFYVSLVPRVQNPNFENELSYSSVSIPDVGFQLLALLRYWNIIEYWYPDRNIIGENWDNVLTEFLPRIAFAKNKEDYQLQMLALIARLNDTHANLWSSMNVQPPVGACQVPARIRFVENHAVVAGFDKPETEKTSKLKIGDVIEAVDGLDVAQSVKDRRQYYAASKSQRGCGIWAAD